MRMKSTTWYRIPFPRVSNEEIKRGAINEECFNFWLDKALKSNYDKIDYEKLAVNIILGYVSLSRNTTVTVKEFKSGIRFFKVVTRSSYDHKDKLLIAGYILSRIAPIN